MSGKKQEANMYMMNPLASSRHPQPRVISMTDEEAKYEIHQRYHHDSGWVREGGEVHSRVSLITSRHCAQAECGYAVYFSLDSSGLTRP